MNETIPMENTMNQTLYILMRTDMDSLNPGKAMAQACHAANLARAMAYSNETRHDILEAFMEWECQTPQSFGTTIVLSVENEHELDRIVGHACNNAFMAGIVHDPTYPVSDGTVTHLIPVNTCAFVFVPDRTARLARSVFFGLDLHP